MVVTKVSELTPDCLSRPNTVVHLHGSMHEPDGMILTTQDYVKHYANDRLQRGEQTENNVLTFLDFLFKEKNVLFVGYGLAGAGNPRICHRQSAIERWRAGSQGNATNQRPQSFHRNFKGKRFTSLPRICVNGAGTTRQIVKRIFGTRRSAGTVPEPSALTSRTRLNPLRVRDHVGQPDRAPAF
jgi:hypothetical protein